MSYKLTIVVNNGGLFEGDLGQWQDTFFTFSTYDLGSRLAEVLAFCEDMGYNVEVRYAQKNVRDGSRRS